jgi:CRP-like cAMP-binding protein
MAGTLDIDTLKEQPLLKDLTPGDLAKLSPLLFEKTYPKNSTLFVEGMSGEILYLIHKGSVEITHKSANNAEKVLATLKEGEFLGEMSLIDNRPRTATARVAEEASLLVMTKKAFNVMMEKYPDVALKVVMVFLKTANERLRKANELTKQV